jgi:hypothetical protein
MAWGRRGEAAGAWRAARADRKDRDQPWRVSPSRAMLNPETNWRGRVPVPIRRAASCHDEGDPAAMPDATLEETVNAIVSLAVGDKLPMRAAVIAKLALPPSPKSLDMGLYGQATNDAKKVLAANRVPQVAKTLDSPLTDLFVTNSLEKSLFRYDKQLMQLIKNSPGYQPPQEQTIQKLVTAFAQCEHQDVLATSHARALTIRQFLTSGQVGQMATINAIWNECTIAGAYNTQANAMHEPVGDVALLGRSQLPSSVHPERDRTGKAVTFTRGRSGTPFRVYGIGFRVEGSYDRTKGESANKLGSSIDRINKTGMVPQVTLNWLMLDNGKNIDGTTVSANALAPRLNIAQRDLWNESGVCVARSFFGATAFPLRGHKGGALLWAINVSGLVGYDTEAWQLANPAAGAGPWRPGEKCFAKIPADRILGHIVIEKDGDDQGGWSFRVPKDAQWSQKVSGANKTQRDYIEAELNAWRDTEAHVPTLFDFQQ